MAQSSGSGVRKAGCWNNRSCTVEAAGEATASGRSYAGVLGYAFGGKCLKASTAIFSTFFALCTSSRLFPVSVAIARQTN